MIRYVLRCAQGHDFDSWFRSAEAADRLIALGQVTCPDCGTAEVGKAPMSPSLQGRGDPLPAVRESPRAAALRALRRHIEEVSEDVGSAFAAEARRIHAGEAPERPIHGEARLDEARRLIEDGIPVAPLPFVPMRKVN
jgi:hypothetical protein